MLLQPFVRAGALIRFRFDEYQRSIFAQAVGPCRQILPQIGISTWCIYYYKSLKREQRLPCEDIGQLLVRQIGRVIAFGFPVKGRAKLSYFFRFVSSKSLPPVNRMITHPIVPSMHMTAKCL